MPAAGTATLEEYELVCAKLREISSLSGISGLLDWDEMVMLPAGAAGARAKQKAALAGVLHEKRVAPELGAALQRLHERGGELSEVQVAVVRDARRDFRRTAALTKELAQRKAQLESRGYQAWVDARAASDFSLFAPVLSEWIAHTRETAALIDPAAAPYDVCLDTYEKGMTAARLDEIFAQVKAALMPLLARLRAAPTKPSASCLAGTFDTEVQAKLCAAVAQDLGFSMKEGRLDVSVHPFTGGSHPTDVRMTTRFKPDDLVEGLSGAIHETGHALYEQGRNLAHDGLPVSEALSMGVHESQSLLWERMVGLSKPFAEYLLPKVREHFPDFAPGAGAGALYAALNMLRQPPLIRVEADEVAYPLHVILRYELERGLVEGTIQVEELPVLWNAKMREYLGAEPPSDAQGVLQDVHWSMGAIGYFPTYTLGAMMAVQLWEAARAALPSLEADVAAGQFSGLRGWLKQQVHSLGSLPASCDELMERVTGKPLDPQLFIDYLDKKYTELYGL